MKVIPDWLADKAFPPARPSVWRSSQAPADDAGVPFASFVRYLLGGLIGAVRGRNRKGPDEES